MLILITGTSSSGKSSVCESLHRKLGDSWLCFSTDGYLSMLGEKFWRGLHPSNPEVCTPNDICYAKQHTDGTYEIIPGKFCSKLYSTIPAALDLLAQQGFNVIVDSFITTKEEFNSYKDALGKYGTLFTHLYAAEPIITQREIARGDRLQGSALHWLKRFNCQDICNLSIDTGNKSIEEISGVILQHYARLNTGEFDLKL